MDNESKFISGLSKPEIIQNQKKYFSESEKHQIINELLTEGCTKSHIWKKYTGQKDHGELLEWMRKLGYSEKIIIRRTKFASNQTDMTSKKKANEPVNSTTESFEYLQLKKRIKELEEQLKDAEMKAIAFSTMVDIAERELKISIRKKFNTKPSKK